MGDAFRAIADPTRRSIFDILTDRERAVEELVPRFAMSFSAVSQHLSVLLDAGLVSRRADGRHRLYRAVPDGLRDVHSWTASHMAPHAQTQAITRIRWLADQERLRSPHPGILHALRPTA